METIPNLAFPQTYEYNNGTVAHFGLTKREYFAGLALQAVISSNRYGEFEIPYWAVKYADALLLELENKK
jgi:hypothetical protein